VEQSILAQTCDDSGHTRIFTAYNVTALLAGALGGLAAAGLGLQHLCRPGMPPSPLRLLAIGTVALFLGLTADAEAQHAPADVRPDSCPPSRLPTGIRRLSALFAVDAFAGGLAVQAVLALVVRPSLRGQHRPARAGVLRRQPAARPGSAHRAPCWPPAADLLGAMLLPHFASNLILACIPFAADPRHRGRAAARPPGPLQNRRPRPPGPSPPPWSGQGPHRRRQHDQHRPQRRRLDQAPWPPPPCSPARSPKPAPPSCSGGLGHRLRHHLWRSYRATTIT